MADSKISALPASTTPLDGTEVLPIVQSSTTKQVTVANLTAGRAVSALSFASTTGANFATTSGNVGVGTTSPETYGVFTIVGNNPIASLVPANLTGATSTLNLWGSTGGVLFKAASIKGTNAGQLTLETPAGVGTGSFMVFSTSATERMRLDSGGNLGIGTSSPSASAILDAQSTTRGVRMPNMTTTQKNAIASPAAGLMVFDTTLAKLCVYTGAAWQTVTSV